MNGSSIQDGPCQTGYTTWIFPSPWPAHCCIRAFLGVEARETFICAFLLALHFRALLQLFILQCDPLEASTNMGPQLRPSSLASKLRESSICRKGWFHQTFTMVWEYYNGKILFITGGTGVIGTALLYRLLTQSAPKRVYVLSRGGYSWVAKICKVPKCNTNIKY